MSETPGLTEREQEHLAVAVDLKADRRPIDADLRNVADWRDTLLCAASNLECGVPQQQATVAAELRALADELVRFSLARQDLGTMRGILTHAVLPAVQQREDVMLVRMVNDLIRLGKSPPSHVG